MTPAPCIECPQFSTLLPFWNVHIFRALQANVLFSTARAVAPGIPLFLAPGSAQPENTVDVFARPSNPGAIFSGPEIGGFRAGDWCSRGAWGEAYYFLTPCLHTHWGAGFDDPIDRDLAASQISLNKTGFANLI